MEEMKLLLSKSSSFRKVVTEKQCEMKECEEQIKELIKQKEKVVWDLFNWSDFWKTSDIFFYFYFDCL